MWVWLVLLVFTAYGGVLEAGFIGLDDPAYVTRNPHVREGLSLEGLLWAFTTFHATNWHPLTWLSHQLDQTLFGDGPLGPHLVNVCLHATSSVLVYALFLRLGRNRFAAGLGAALFAVHPLHVESTAWISERKDMLSLALLLASFVFRLDWLARPNRRAKFLSAAFGALALLAKPTAVTLPAVWILLEWFHNAADGFSLKRALVDNIPWFLLAFFVSTLTLLAQAAGGAPAPIGDWGVDDRIGQALWAAFFYPYKLLWPTGLAVLYPLGEPSPLWATAIRGLGLALLLAGAWRARRTAPYVLFGLLWYCGTLLPMSGLVQVGVQAAADRYAYLPGLGLYCILVTFVGRLGRSPKNRPAIRACCSVVLILLGFATTRSVEYWQSDLTLFGRAMRVAPSYVAAMRLGDALAGQNRFDEALETYLTGLAFRPEASEALFAAGSAAYFSRRVDLAEALMERALAADEAAGAVQPKRLRLMASVKETLGKSEQAQTLQVKAQAIEAQAAAAPSPRVDQSRKK